MKFDWHYSVKQWPTLPLILVNFRYFPLTRNKLIDEKIQLNSHEVIIAKLENYEPKKMREACELLNKKFNGVIFLTSIYENKINIIVSISKNYTNKFNASEIIKSLSNIIGGGGGGNPQIAQGGGTEINSQSKSIEAFKNIIQNA